MERMANSVDKLAKEVFVAEKPCSSKSSASRVLWVRGGGHYFTPFARQT